MTVCPCCSGGDSRLLFSAGDHLFLTTPERFDLFECRNCRVVFIWPVPAEAKLAGYYPRGYWWKTAEREGGRGLWHNLLEAYRRLLTGGQVRRAARLMSNATANPARFLDIGCGDGLFLATCERLPLARFGIDQSLEALRAASARGGLGLIQGKIEALPFADESFGLITLVHVLEHVSSPGPCLQEARRLLRRGGWLVVQVPNAASLQRYLLRRRWEGFDVPRHLVDYTAEALCSVLERHGFEVKRTDHFSFRDNPPLLVRSFFPRLYPPSRRAASSLPKEDSRLDGLLDVVYLLLALLAVPFAYLEGALGRGATVIVEARKL